jgi:NADH-quinone oxidoreductase subunit I
MGKTINVRERDESFGAYEKSYLPEITKGIGITLRHVVKNLFSPKAERYTRTVSYPEEKVAYPERFRGLHRLVPREDGAPRCVACFMCSTACPARCISIVAEASDDPTIEKRPLSFEIDELKCIFCGLCVEACPEDAIRMDTGVHASPTTNRADAIMGKVDLLEMLGRHEAGGAGPGIDFNGAHVNNPMGPGAVLTGGASTLGPGASGGSAHHSSEVSAASPMPAAAPQTTEPIYRGAHEHRAREAPQGAGPNAKPVQGLPEE